MLMIKSPLQKIIQTAGVIWSLVTSSLPVVAAGRRDPAPWAPLGRGAGAAGRRWAWVPLVRRNGPRCPGVLAPDSRPEPVQEPESVRPRFHPGGGGGAPHGPPGPHQGPQPAWGQTCTVTSRRRRHQTLGMSKRSESRLSHTDRLFYLKHPKNSDSGPSPVHRSQNQNSSV